MARQIYPSIVDAINNATFECQVYGGFVERVPLYFRMFPDRIPLHSNTQGHSTAPLTIVQMVERNHRNEHFSIMKPDDVLAVLGYVDRYVEHMGPIIDAIEDPGDPAKVLLAKIRTFQKDMGKNRAGSKKASNQQHHIKEPTRSAHSILKQLGNSF